MTSKKTIAAINPMLVLSIINREESYAYDIIKKVSSKSMSKLTMHEGTLYPLLKRLKTEHYIKSRWKNMPLGHKRKYYSITQKGKNHLKELNKEWNEINDILTSFL